jgi:hypothetical protein
MTTWIIKSEADDPDRALANVEDQRSKGYTAWIEDEHGKAVDEELLRTNKAVPSKPTLRERATGIETRRIAANIAKLPNLLQKTES